MFFFSDLTIIYFVFAARMCFLMWQGMNAVLPTSTYEDSIWNACLAKG